MRDAKPMRATFANKKINRHVVRDWAYWQEECRRNLAATIGRRTAAAEKAAGTHPKPDPEWVRMMNREAPEWFLKTKKERRGYKFTLTAENILQFVWNAYHNGYRYGRKTAGAEDNKVPGMPKG